MRCVASKMIQTKHGGTPPEQGSQEGASHVNAGVGTAGGVEQRAHPRTDVAVAGRGADRVLSACQASAPRDRHAVVSERIRIA